MPKESAMAEDIRAQVQKALADAYKAAKKEWPDNPARLEQLKSHLDTASMAVDHLATETPYQGA
jgi:hypothetical protein